MSSFYIQVAYGRWCLNFEPGFWQAPRKETFGLFTFWHFGPFSINRDNSL